MLIKSPTSYFDFIEQLLFINVGGSIFDSMRNNGVDVYW